MNKKCLKCGVSKPFSEFYKNRFMRDGHLNKCKACVIVASQKNRAANIDRLLSYDRSRAHLPHRVEARAKYAESPEGRTARQRASANYRKTHPEKRAAHVVAGNAVRDGRLIKGLCEQCGSPNVQAHHDDYSKPLEVRWLCSAHHANHHVQLRTGGN